MTARLSISAATRLRGNVSAEDDSQVNLWGQMAGNLLALGNSEVAIREGAVVGGNATAMGGARLAIDGSVAGNVLGLDDGLVAKRYQIDLRGSVGENLIADDLGIVEVHDGATIVGNLEAGSFTQIQLNGGVVMGNAVSAGSTGPAFLAVLKDGRIHGNVIAATQSLFQLGKGSVGGTVSAHETARVIIGIGKLTTIGNVGQNVLAFDQSVVDVRLGSILGDLVGHDGSTINMQGGLVHGQAKMSGNATLNWSGGLIGGEIPPAPSSLMAISFLEDDVLQLQSLGLSLPGVIAHDSATINIIGRDLTAELVDPNYEDMFRAYQLTGTLADGTPLTSGPLLLIQNDSGASFQLMAVPEPATVTLALAALAILAMAVLRRNRRRKLSS